MKVVDVIGGRLRSVVERKYRCRKDCKSKWMSGVCLWIHCILHCGKL